MYSFLACYVYCLCVLCVCFMGLVPESNKWLIDWLTYTLCIQYIQCAGMKKTTIIFGTVPYFFHKISQIIPDTICRYCYKFYHLPLPCSDVAQFWTPDTMFSFAQPTFSFSPFQTVGTFEMYERHQLFVAKRQKYQSRSSLDRFMLKQSAFCVDASAQTLLSRLQKLTIH